MVRFVFLVLTASCATAQVVQDFRVFSELQRIDPFGAPLALDHFPSVSPREILSPAVARNAHFTLQVAVTAPPKTMYFLAVQSNPEDLFQWKLYKQLYSQRSETWIPDRLVEMKSPFFEVMPDTEVVIPKQNTQVFVVDVFVPAETPVGRVRLEVLVKSDAWRLYPMEVRVLPVTIPAASGTVAAVELPPDNAPSDASARKAIGQFQSGGVLSPPPSATANLRSMVYRNALQDMRLARTVSKAQVCWEQTGPRETQGAEWYLKVRDCLYRQASVFSH